MPNSVREAGSDLVTMEVLVDGAAIPDTFMVVKLEIEHQVNRIPVAKVTIADGSAAKEDFAVSDSSTFVPGGKIELKLGYHAKNKTVFKGLILRQNIRVEPGGDSYLILTCNDEAIKTTIARSSVQFNDATDAEAIGRLLSDAGLTSDVEATRPKHDHQIKSYASDWDFILSRAEANGQVVIVEGGKVSVAAPSFSGAKLSASFGDTISQLDLELDATEQIGSVTSSDWDPASQEVVGGRSSEPQLNEQGNLTGEKLAEVLGLPSRELRGAASMDAVELGTLANAQLLRTRLARIRGRVAFSGNAGIRPGELLDLSGLGKRFNGAGYVSAVRHQAEAGNWSTEVELGLSPDSYADRNRTVTAPPAAGLRPGVNGLQIAKVLKIDEDPRGERRIEVALPLLTGDKQGLWIRMASPYATMKAGFDFMPEIGDEIVLGFLDGDPDAGIMLGALNSSARPAPLAPDQANSHKAIVTNSQMKISFDEVKKVLTVETPGGHMIALSDDEKTVTVSDCNANSLAMAEDGITLSSPKRVTIEAKGAVAIKGAGGVTVSSPSDVALQGANASVKADMAVTVSGNASAELSASGVTRMRGAMVEIN